MKQKLKENTLSKTFSTILFFGCTTFVVHRGYACFSKYMKEPEILDESYEFTGHVPFPSLSFCFRQDWDPKPLKENVLKECNLSIDEYVHEQKWAGTGSANCSNPDMLLE